MRPKYCAVVAARVEERGVAAHGHPLHLHLGPHAVPADDARVNRLLARGLHIADELVGRLGARRQAGREHAAQNTQFARFHRLVLFNGKTSCRHTFPKVGYMIPQFSLIPQAGESGISVIEMNLFMSDY